MVTILPMGERAFLVEVDSLEGMLSLHAALAASRPEGVLELVPAARTVLVVVDPSRMPMSVARDWASAAEEESAALPPAAGPDGVVVDVPVRYDGPDLAETAALLGMPPRELIDRHRSARWSVAFTGFAPGFAYLVSPDWAFEVPRLAAPRTRVPVGAIGVAGGFTGAYPRATPGGWRLIGSTDAVLFDPGSSSPALLPPGAHVRFTEVRS